MNDTERYIKDRATVMSIIKYALIVAVSGLLIYFATRVISVMVPFLVGFLLAKTSHVLATPFTRTKKGKATFDSKKRKRIEITIYGILVVIILIAAVFAILSLIGQGSRAFTSIKNYAVNISDMEKLEDILWNISDKRGGFLSTAMVESILLNITQIQEQIIAALPDVVTKVAGSVWGIVGNIPYGIFVVISVFMSGYYFISDGPYVLKAYMKSIPNHSFRRSSLELVNNLSVTLFRALGGYLLLLIITMTEAWIAFRIAGIEYAMVLALITAVLDFLPVLGISATMIPVILYCAFHENYFGVAVIIIAMAIMTVIRRAIEPPIVGKSLHLHPLLMLISMAVGVYIWGAIGFLMGPVVFIIVLDIVKVFGINKKFSVFLSRILEKFMKPADEEKETVKTSD